MIRSRGRECTFKGSVTAFLALVFLLVLSLVGALLESASAYVRKHDQRTRTRMALESFFAEFSAELLQKYDIFARVGASESLLQNKLEFYGAEEMEHSMQKAEYLTDRSGKTFYEQATLYAKNWLGLDEVMLGTEYEFSDDDLEEEENGILASIRKLLEEEKKELQKEDNPLQNIQWLKSMEILNLVAPKDADISKQSVSLSNLPSHRSLNKGNYKGESQVGTLDKVFFIAYVAEHFSHYQGEGEDTALSYECEYLIGGKKSDKANLEVVCRRIMQIRMVANYGYLLTDTAKQMEAEVLATALCSVVGLPEVIVLVKHALLLAWAYGESVVDVRVLLKGNKSPFIKTKETWQLKLSNLIKLGTEQEVTGEKSDGDGLSYKDYLYGLLLLEKNETLSMRSLDLIESNLGIKTDQCMTKTEVHSTYELWRGVNDSFTTFYAYQ